MTFQQKELKKNWKRIEEELKNDRPYSSIIKKVTVNCWYLLFGCHSEMTPYLPKSYYYLNILKKTDG